METNDKAIGTKRDNFPETFVWNRYGKAYITRNATRQGLLIQYNDLTSPFLPIPFL